MRALLLALLIPLAGCEESPPAPPEGGSAVIVFIDTLRADRLGCHGYPERTTPFLDRVARQGAQFWQTYSTAPWTYASTASLVTGLYPPAHGGFTPGDFRNHTTNPYPPPLSEKLQTIAEILSPWGWKTALFSANPYVGLGVEQGFHHYELQTNSASRQVDSALRWLDALEPGEDFVLILHLIDVHEPNNPPRRYRQMFEGGDAIRDEQLALYGSSNGRYGTGRPETVEDYPTYRERRLAVYDASVRYTDRQVRRLFREVEERRPPGETLYVVTADHGEEFWEHGEIQKANYRDPRNIYGLAHGHSFFDELMRVPLILHSAGGPRVRPERGADVARGRDADSARCLRGSPRRSARGNVAPAGDRGRTPRGARPPPGLGRLRA